MQPSDFCTLATTPTLHPPLLKPHFTSSHLPTIVPPISLEVRWGGGYARSQLTLLKHGCLLICSPNRTEEAQGGGEGGVRDRIIIEREIGEGRRRWWQRRRTQNAEVWRETRKKPERNKNYKDVKERESAEKWYIKATFLCTEVAGMYANVITAVHSLWFSLIHKYSYFHSSYARSFVCAIS